MGLMGFAALYPSYTSLAPRLTRQRHQSASNQPELILKVPRPSRTREIRRFRSIGFGEAAMKQTIMWLALALLFAIGMTLSVIADSFGPAATAATTAPPAPIEAPQPVIEASATPAAPSTPEVPVAMLDDVPQKSAVTPEALARWFVAPGAPPVAETLLTPSPLAPATTIAARPGPDARAAVPLPEADARPVRKPRDSHAQLPVKRRTANTKGCGSQSRFTDLLRTLNLASRCPARRSAA
jgi:hypothetical protein